MRIIRFAELAEVPWKNGGGVTREIAAERKSDAIVWRLSIADVASDGPFSKFENLRRILTVTQGQGMELVGATGVLQADLAVPVVFDGNLEIVSRLKDGPVRDFNVIHDPDLCRVDVALWRGGEVKTLSATDAKSWAVHCVTGEVVLNGKHRLQSCDTAVLCKGNSTIVLKGKSCGLVVSIDLLDR
jgi:uncharacterized protein